MAFRELCSRCWNLGRFEPKSGSYQLIHRYRDSASPEEYTCTVARRRLRIAAYSTSRLDTGKVYWVVRSDIDRVDWKEYSRQQRLDIEEDYSMPGDIGMVGRSEPTRYIDTAAYFVAEPGS